MIGEANEDVLDLVRTPRDLKNKPLSQKVKYWLAYLAERADSSHRQVGKVYNISHVTIGKWVLAMKENRILHEKGGRPCLVDAQTAAFIMTSLHAPMPVPQFKSLVDKAVEDRFQELNRPMLQFNGLSRQSMKRLKARYELKSGNAEENTKAREVAVSCPRNALTFAAMNKYMSEKVSKHTMLNMDATQFEVGNTHEERVASVYLARPADGKPLKVPKQDDTDHGGLHYYIKYFLLMTADGRRADPVFCIADPSMKEDEYTAYYIEGLGIDTTAIGKAFGWLVVCSTRCCNVAFYKWLNRELIVPTVQKIKAANNLPDTATTFLQLDGEAVQIAPYEDDVVLEQLAEHNIVVGKPPASTTSITQPCDVGNCFKAAKTHLKAVHDRHVETDPMRKVLEAKLKEHIDARKAAYIKKHGCDTGFKSLASHKKVAALGLLRVLTALKDTMKISTIEKSFEKCGVYPYSFKKIMQQCTAKLTPAMVAQMEACMPAMVQLFKEKGEVSDADMDAMGLPAGRGVKDTGAVQKRRSIILTHPQHIAKEFVKASGNTKKKDPKPPVVQAPTPFPEEVPPPPPPAPPAKRKAAPVPVSNKHQRKEGSRATKTNTKYQD